MNDESANFFVRIDSFQYAQKRVDDCRLEQIEETETERQSCWPTNLLGMDGGKKAVVGPYVCTKHKCFCWKGGCRKKKVFAANTVNSKMVLRRQRKEHPGSWTQDSGNHPTHMHLGGLLWFPLWSFLPHPPFSWPFFHTAATCQLSPLNLTIPTVTILHEASSRWSGNLDSSFSFFLCNYIYFRLVVLFCFVGSNLNSLNPIASTSFFFLLFLFSRAKKAKSDSVGHTRKMTGKTNIFNPPTTHTHPPSFLSSPPSFFPPPPLPLSLFQIQIVEPYHEVSNFGFTVWSNFGGF